MDWVGFASEGYERLFHIHAATADSSDENLKARIPAAVGESEEERKRERLSEPTRSILDAPDAAIQSALLSSPSPGVERMAQGFSNR